MMLKMTLKVHSENHDGLVFNLFFSNLKRSSFLKKQIEFHHLKMIDDEIDTL